ncbi:ras-like protein family member 11B [Hemicordylus capensis]|uniref:ras-like protein family member 11B n=1 Tax=Hemicordylus capensis TaxID=884348 RepID=UPI00230335D9|nr:ras-like protein family member 11B [Hemicordylus capensis]
MRLIQNMGTIAEYPQTGSATSGDGCGSGGTSGRPRLIKIAVVGASGVGKTALVVRFLTKRFIGDYERNAGNLYSRQIEIDGEMFAIQVQDTPGVQVHGHSLVCNEQLNRCIRWADAVVIVFSITDYKSYELLGHFHQQIRQLHPGNRVPVVVIANKADLLHVKEVEPQHGLQLANMWGCTFYEVSVSENYKEVFNAFHSLCKDVCKQQTSTPEKRRTSLIPRPKSPNMQDLKRRFKQALSAKVRTVTSV